MRTRFLKPTGLIIAIAAAIVLLIAACGGDDDSDATASPSASGECSANLEFSLGEVTWPELFPSQLLEKDEWRVLRGQAEGPYVSVSRNLDVVGAITLSQTDLASDFLPADGIDALSSWVDDLYTNVLADRESTYGDGYVFESATPAETTVGTFCAITFGYTGEDGGDEVDRLAGYATFDRGSLYLITAEYDVTYEGEVGFHEAATLADFEALFPDFIASLSLPPGSEASDEPSETPDEAAQTE